MDEIIPNPKATGVRWFILALVFINVVINYMDRSNLSIAAPAMAKDLKLDPAQLGDVMAAFGMTYAALQIPGGLLADLFAPRILYTFTLTLWSAATLCQGLARGAASMFGLRLATGVFEAPSYPINNRIATTWFPDQERATAIGTYTSGQFLGLAFLMPVLTKIQAHLTWRGLFAVTGLAGILWAVAWYLLYRDPLSHPRVNEAELGHIEIGGGLLNRKTAGAKPKPKINWSDFQEVLSHRKLWGIYLGQFSVTSTQWFFLTWFPSYLVTARNVDISKMGWLGSLPFLAAFAGVLSSGYFSDWQVKKGVSLAVARKGPMIGGLLLVMSIFGANYTNSTTLIICFMSLAFFGNGAASIGWIFVSALAPRRLVGLTGGTFNFISQLSSFIIPWAIGHLIKHYNGNFAPALVLVGLISALGACSYIFLVGKIERVQIAGEEVPLPLAS